MNLSAVILAGGQSRRMGRDKARLQRDGQSLLARAVATVREVGARETFISGRADRDDAEWGCPVLFDREPGLGPVGGIERALHECASPLLLVLAVDLPQITTAFLRKLVAAGDPLTGVVPELNGELEPLVAIYPQRCHALAAALLANGRRAACDFAVACLSERAVRAFAVAPADAGCFTNWNSGADVVPAIPCAKSTPRGSDAGKLCP